MTSPSSEDLFECDDSYNPVTEIMIYLGTVSYLSIGLVLHFSLLRTILVTEKRTYKESSFFHIFALDSMALWKTVLPVARVLILVVPFGGTWNLWLSNIHAEPQFGGFTMSYDRAVKWAALSLFQTIYILTAFAITVVCTTVTLFKMIVLPERIKSAEKSLCFTSIFISITYLLVATTQILWITCCADAMMFAIQFLAFDSFTVGSAVIVFLVNKPLRESVFKRRAKSARVSVVHSRTFN
uniref:Serpentine receptor class gamma n=1 Tax=Caenorhabditis tropicalis TaxID=1561998 RepID=A0A1I7UGU4_9PELO